MGSDVETPPEQTEPPAPFTFEQAQVMNTLLNSAGFKGSNAKRLASDIQLQLETWYPQLMNDDG